MISLFRWCDMCGIRGGLCQGILEPQLPLTVCENELGDLACHPASHCSNHTKQLVVLAWFVCSFKRGLELVLGPAVGR